MKKKSVLSLVLAASMAAVMSVGAFAATGTGNYIGEERAKAIALESAGLTAEQVTLINVRLDRDDGYNLYDVKFYTYNTEYDYEIDAVSGEIWEYDYDIDYRVAEDGTLRTVQAAAPGSRYISEDEAKAIALDAAGFTEAQVLRLKVDLDREHGTTVYEVEFRDDFTEYDYEINAVDGMLLKGDVEYGD